MNDRRIVLSGFVLVALSVALAFPPLLADVVRVVVAFLLVILPGYAMMRALFPPGSLDASRRATVALASGIWLLAVGGLLLNRLPPGLTGPAWLALSVIAVLLSIMYRMVPGHMAARRTGLAGGSHGFSAGLARWRLALAVVGSDAAARLDRRPDGLASVVASVALVIVLAIAALSIATQGAIEQNRAQAFTEFWAVGQPGSDKIGLGIQSHELSSIDYSVRVESGRWFTTFEGITVEPGGSWETSFTPPALATPSPGLASPLRALLFRDGSATPYRELTLRRPGSP